MIRALSRYSARKKATAAPAAAPVASTARAPAAPTPDFGIPYEAEKLNNVRKTIARRLTEAKQTIPHFYLTVDCNLDALLAAREAINAAAPKNKDKQPAYKISVNDFVIKAMALALAGASAATDRFWPQMREWLAAHAKPLTMLGRKRLDARLYWFELEVFEVDLLARGERVVGLRVDAVQLEVDQRGLEPGGPFSAIDQHPAMFQIVEIRALGMKNGLQI